jgi:cellulose synthase/poly-beta-1,6-N-acetylglucosamine synthase-like glycosyltransferase
VAVAYAIALSVITLFGVNHFWLALRFARTRQQRPGPVPASMPIPELPADPPMVTVQIPMFNEALVADRVIAACARLDYPGAALEIQVLDDSTDATVGVVADAVRFWRAQGLNMVHIHRTHRTGYKAGALAEGLRVARGEFVAMFDADFVPPRNFLRALMHRFTPPDVGFVQARWGHLNDASNTLTRLQGFGLDAHFALEQESRTSSGYPAGFNGTAGIWRKSCIRDAGGWSADTLTEDLDLSYRAQLRGWRMVYVSELVVPAELPMEMGGFRAQQHRWTKGAVQVAIKLVGRVATSKRSLGFRVQGILQLTANIGFPFLVVVALLHAPLGYQKALGGGPGEVYFALLGLGLAGFGGFFGAHLLTQRALYPDWGGRIWRFPLFLAASVGMAVSNSVAVGEALIGRTSPFVRTPKFNSVDTSEASAWWRSTYARTRVSPVTVIEAVFAVYTTLGLGALVAVGAWSAVPFQMLFVTGSWLVVWFTLRDARLARRVLVSGSEGNVTVVT